MLVILYKLGKIKPMGQHIKTDNKNVSKQVLTAAQQSTNMQIRKQLKQLAHTVKVVDNLTQTK